MRTEKVNRREYQSLRFDEAPAAIRRYFNAW